MKAEFTALVQKLVAEQGRDALFNTAKCKAFLADYTGSEYQNERRLLLQVVEAGITSGIANTGDLAAYKRMAVQKLQDDYYLAPNVTGGVVDMLALVLRGDVKQKTVCRNCGKELQDEWKACPYCGTEAATSSADTNCSATTSELSSTITSSGVGGYGVGLIETKAIPQVEQHETSASVQNKPGMNWAKFAICCFCGGMVAAFVFPSPIKDIVVGILAAGMVVGIIFAGIEKAKNEKE
jgi:hypothetical protein